MANLNIKLIQEYKSFPQEFETTLEWNLILISWVNGSGKSHLMELIKWYYPNDPNKDINSIIEINGILIHSKDILYRSFRDNILQVSNIGNTTPQNIINHKNQIYSNYTGWIFLNSQNRNLRDYQKSAIKAKELLIHIFWEEKFNSWRITQQEILDKIPNEFIWSADNIFSNIVADLFFVYASKKNDLIVSRFKEGRGWEGIDFESILWVPPWIELNSLFSDLKIDYRFKKDYEIQWSFLDEQPKLYSFQDWSIDLLKSREIEHLSDGEKVITSLIFSSLNKIDSKDIKLLLLDEFDATFNPSLTEMFYKVIDEYFIKKWIIVIIVTHSSTTISLAPENANFYEVRKKGNTMDRIIKIWEEDYEELKIAHQKFYKRIAYREEQIKDLEKQLWISGDKPIIYVEWPTDIIYIRKWADLLGKNDILNRFDLRIIWEVTPEWTKNSNDQALINAGTYLSTNLDCIKSKIIIFHDPENSASEETHKNKLYIRKIKRHSEYLIQNGIEWLFHKDFIEKTKTSKEECFCSTNINNWWKKKTEIKIIQWTKSQLCNWICENTIKEDFIWFEHIFDELDSIYQVNPVTVIE